MSYPTYNDMFLASQLRSL